MADNLESQENRSEKHAPETHEDSKSPEEGVEAKDIAMNLREFNIKIAVQLKEAYKLSNESIENSVRINNAAAAALGTAVRAGRDIEISNIKKHFLFSQEKINEIAPVIVAAMFSRTGPHYSKVSDFFRGLEIPEEVLQSPDIRRHVYNATEIEMSELSWESVDAMRDDFHLTPETLKNLARNAIEESMRSAHLGAAVHIKEHFELSEEEVRGPEFRKMLDEGLTGYFHGYDATQAFLDGEDPEFDLFSEKLPLTNEDFQESQRVQSSMRELISRYLNRGNIDQVKVHQKTLEIPHEFIFEIAKERIISMLERGRSDEANTIQNSLEIREEIIQSTEVQEAAVTGMVYHLGDASVRDAELIRDNFSVSTEQVNEALKGGLISQLEQGQSTEAMFIKQHFSVSDDVLSSSGVAHAAKTCIVMHLDKAENTAELVQAGKIKKEFNIADDDFRSTVIRGLSNALMGANTSTAFSIKQFYNLTDEEFKQYRIQEAGKKGMQEILWHGSFGRGVDVAIGIRDEFNIEEKNAQEAARFGIIYHLENKTNIKEAIKIKEKLGVTKETLDDRELRLAAVRAIIRSYRHDWRDVADTIKKELYISDDHLKEPLLAATIFSTKRFNPPITEVDPSTLTDEEYKDLHEIWVSIDKDWDDEQNIAAPFDKGVEVFGYKKMCEFMKSNQWLTTHDALHAFDRILELHQASGLSANDFHGRILQQVAMDDRDYSEGTAHHHLNSLAQTVNLDIEGVIKKAEQFKDIERLQELGASFESPQNVFDSWGNLKRYSELEQLLGRSDLLQELSELKEQNKKELYRYIETLAFHPDSKVNMSAVMQFWRDPEAFFDAEASHTPHNVQEQKKPTNYIEIPNLDLTAEELRDALVEGKLDELTIFNPLEVRYEIPLEDIKQESLNEFAKKALGSQKNNIEGAAKDPKKLFNELNKILKPLNISVIEYIGGESLPEDEELEQHIESLVYDPTFGMEKPQVKSGKFVARINRKSDPEGAIAGDDTVNCMPFGDGKNTVYTFNPNTAQFVLRIVNAEGKERTIAQSVLTKDADIKELIPDVIKKLESEGEHLEDVLPAEILDRAQTYIACDNVEVAPNYSREEYKRILEIIFRDFFREYMDRYARESGLERSKVPIGMSFSDALTKLPTEKNTFAPQAPVSYSDKTGEEVYILDLKDKRGLDQIQKKEVKESEVPRKEASPSKIKGIEYLTFEDSLKVAYLEGKAYESNESLMQFLFNMENGLIAKDINNAAKERPNMSLKYSDENGRMRGYMLAWEGKISDHSVQESASEFFGQDCLYISDLATDQENKLAGGRLIRGFAELYAENYLKKENPVPIFAQTRESTSFRIVKRQLDRIGKDMGVDFELIELPTYTVGEDEMHPIIIQPKKT